MVDEDIMAIVRHIESKGASLVLSYSGRGYRASVYVYEKRFSLSGSHDSMIDALREALSSAIEGLDAARDRALDDAKANMSRYAKYDGIILALHTHKRNLGG